VYLLQFPKFSIQLFYFCLHHTKVASVYPVIPGPVYRAYHIGMGSKILVTAPCRWLKLFEIISEIAEYRPTRNPRAKKLNQNTFSYNNYLIIAYLIIATY